MKKLIWPVLGLILMAVLTTVQDASSDSRIDAQEWVQVALQAIMAFNVWATANLPQYGKMKTYVAAVIAVVSLLYTVIIGGVSTQEIINLVITGLAALGVAATPQPVTTVSNGRTITPDNRVATNG
jgi:uncharacterized membrane protein